MRIYCIGDIHGYLDQLTLAHARIARDRKEIGDETAPVVHLGDLVDRGPDSRGVIEYLMRGKRQGAPWIVLAGNHDRIFAEQVGAMPRSDFSFASWLSANMGGRHTAASYGVELSSWKSEAWNRASLTEAVPDEHGAFLKSLPTLHAAPGLVFVHAGIRPGVPLTQQAEEDLLWIRRSFLEDPRDHGALIVHGHTPVDTPMHCGNRVNLDTGAGYGRPITAAVFEGQACHVLEEDGRRPLLPAE